MRHLLGLGEDTDICSSFYMTSALHSSSHPSLQEHFLIVPILQKNDLRLLKFHHLPLIQGVVGNGARI